MIFTSEYSFSQALESFLGGFSVFLTGVTMVFFALVLLILLIKVISMIVEKIENKDKVCKQNIEQPKEVVNIPTSTPVVKQTDDLELVAVITAAIAASLGTTTDKLMVRSLRQVNRRTR